MYVYIKIFARRVLSSICNGYRDDCSRRVSAHIQVTSRRWIADVNYYHIYCFPARADRLRSTIFSQTSDAYEISSRRVHIVPHP